MNSQPSQRPPRASIVRYARFLHDRAVAVIIAALVVTGVSIALAAKLDISTDLSAVLPRSYPSVQDLHKLLARIGGSASLTVAVESPDLKANERFADALVAEVRKELGPEVANIDYKVDAQSNFYRKHAAVYMSTTDLEAIDDDLKNKITQKKLAASPLPYELGLDDDDKPPADAKKSGMDDISARLDKAQEKFARFPDGYYAGEEGKLLAIFIRPRTSGADSKTARQFVERIRQMGNKLDPHSFNPELKFNFTGAYVVSLDEQDAIKRDLVSTAGLCIGLIAIAVTIYFRRIRAIMLLGATLICGCAWAFGLARLAVGYLNIQTAFLGSIIAGTGINYGIIFLARYLEERRRGEQTLDAMTRALDATWLATLAAAMTTSISFGTLLISDISSFRHFAIIGGGGILFCWLLTFSLLPALLVISERITPTVKHTGGGAHWPKPLVALPLRWPGVVVALSLLASIGAGVAFVRFLPNALETDGRNLRNKASGKSGAAKLDERVAHIRMQSMTPGLVVTDSLEEAKRVCDVMNARVKNEGDHAPIKNCTSVYSLLPEDATPKLEIARRILDRLDKLPDDAFNSADKKKLDDLRSQLVLENVEMKDLPEELTRPFREVSGEVGRFVLIYPVPARDLWVKENLDVFTNAIRRIDLGDGRVVTSSGDLVIFADILDMITRDAPRTTLLALCGVIVFVFLALRGGRATAHVVGALVVGVLWMVGVAALGKVKINFFNFVAIPTTFGIAVDYTINLYARYAGIHHIAEKKERLRLALSETGGAIFLCSITTIIGYATLIIADNMALVSFGKLAILGEVMCVGAALLLLPATLLLDRKA